MNARKLSPYVGNGRLAGRLIGNLGVAVERLGLWMQRHGDELRWADRPYRDARFHHEPPA